MSNIIELYPELNYFDNSKAFLDRTVVATPSEVVVFTCEEGKDYNEKPESTEFTNKS